MNRRDFVFSGAAAASAAALGSLAMPGFGAKATESGVIPLYKLVFDSRHEASRAFGAAAELSGTAVAAFGGDVSALWMHDLGPHWARGSAPLAVAGMTTARALVCLEQLARDYWLRVVVRAEHVPAPSGGVDHLLTAHSGALAPTCNALRDDAWPARLAARLVTCPARPADAPVGRASISAPNARTIETPLVSWIISA